MKSAAFEIKNITNPKQLYLKFNAISNAPNTADENEILSAIIFDKYGKGVSFMDDRNSLYRVMVKKLLRIAKGVLGITTVPPIRIIYNNDAILGTAFGLFTDKIQVVAKNRHPVDVMRTLAHELVHWQQICDNRIMDGSTGSDIENEANAIAGIIMRLFAEAHPEYFKVNAVD